MIHKKKVTQKFNMYQCVWCYIMTSGVHTVIFCNYNSVYICRQNSVHCWLDLKLRSNCSTYSSIVVEAILTGVDPCLSTHIEMYFGFFCQFERNSIVLKKKNGSMIFFLNTIIPFTMMRNKSFLSIWKEFKSIEKKIVPSKNNLFFSIPSFRSLWWKTKVSCQFERNSIVLKKKK